jgi:hypothetical protein
MRADLWAGVNSLLDRAPSLDDLGAHGLQLLAARRWRERGREVPPRLAMDELVAAQRTADARVVLEAARGAYEGSLVVLKGPEIAARYPERALRPSSDLDLLADDAEAAQRALIAAGFEPVGEFPDHYYEGLHHLRPLALDRRIVAVEVHRRPNWVDWAQPPGATELIAAAGPGDSGVEGVLALPPAHHALVVAAHSWGERPLRRVLDLLDVAVLAADADRHEIEAIASRWGLARLWRTTIAAADALFLGAPESRAMRTWARELRDVRSRTVLEDHTRRWVSPFWALPAHRALAAAATALLDEVRPVPGESWGGKLTRTREALLHPGRSTAEHVRILGPEGIRPRHKRR